MTGSSALAGAATSAVICLAASPYLARLTRTVPDREDRRWYVGAPPGRTVTVATAVSAVVVGALAGAAAQWSPLLPAYIALALCGTPLVIIDVEAHRLPNRLVYPAAGAAVVLLAWAAAAQDAWGDYLRAIEGAAATYAVLFVLMFIAPRAFGWGDVRLGGVLGGYLGYHSWLTVYYGIFGGFLLGSLVAIALMLMRRATMKTALAFGPMLLLGALIVQAFELSP